MGGLQGAAVIGTVTAHSFRGKTNTGLSVTVFLAYPGLGICSPWLTDIVSNFLQLLDENLLLFWAHSGKDCSTDANAREVFVVSDHLKAVPIHGKNVAGIKG